MFKKKQNSPDLVSIHRGKMGSIFTPSVYLSISTGFLFFLAILVKEYFQIDQKLIEASLMLSAVSLVFGLFIIGAATYFYKITIYTDSLSSFNPWESYKCYNMKWCDMKYFSIKNILGYKYYFIVSSDQTQCLWVPCNIKNKKQFIDNIVPLISKDHIFIKNIKIT